MEELVSPISSIDENKLWKICFPNLYRMVQDEGTYIIRSEEELDTCLRLVGPGRSRVDRAISRLDVAITYMWPYVSDLFIVDFFPHRLAAATEIWRAADFGRGKELRVAALAKELSLALDSLERILAEENGTEEGLHVAEASVFKEE